MTPLDLSAEAIARRIAQASAASDLTAERRLDSKIDLSAEGVSQRLRDVFELNDLCDRIRITHQADTESG
jgi:hypothetical protein